MATTWRILVVAALTAASTAAAGTSIDVLVGDRDGFGIGCSNHAPAGTCIWPGLGNGGSQYDGRSAAEAAATNGAQITDTYSAIFPQFGPNNFTQADVLLPFSGTLLSGIVQVASGDRQVQQGGPIGLAINGFTELFATEQGYRGTGIDTYTLSAAELAAANAIGMVVLHYDHFFPGDLVAFDWFELTGQTDALTPPPPNGAPEPGTLWLTATAVAPLCRVAGVFASPHSAPPSPWSMPRRLRAAALPCAWSQGPPFDEHRGCASPTALEANASKAGPFRLQLAGIRMRNGLGTAHFFLLHRICIWPRT